MRMEKLKAYPPWVYAGLTAAIIGIAGLVEYLMGRVLICTCGYVKLWHGVVHSSENSQHLTDWYTYSHVIHGFAFYWVAGKLFPRMSLSARMTLAVLAEAAWEVFENTSFIINRYRSVTISLDYYGDSVINSMADIAFAALGFWVAAKLPVWATIALTIAMEAGVAYFIRDNLTLNVIMLMLPLEAIRRWQAGI